MLLEIFGRLSCPYCVRAIDIAKQLSEEQMDFKFRYIDMNTENVTKEDLSLRIGKPVQTVPQIFLDNKHIGGCSDFEAYAKQHLGLK